MRRYPQSARPLTQWTQCVHFDRLELAAVFEVVTSSCREKSVTGAGHSNISRIQIANQNGVGVGGVKCTVLIKDCGREVIYFDRVPGVIHQIAGDMQVPPIVDDEGHTLNSYSCALNLG